MSRWWMWRCYQSGFDFCRELTAAWTMLAIIMLAEHDDDILLEKAWVAGAAALLLNHAEPDVLLEAIRQAAAGRKLFSLEQRRRIQTWERDIGAGVRAVTPREWDVLQLLMDGRGNAEISQALIVSENTVEKHVSALLSKLGLRSRAEL